MSDLALAIHLDAPLQSWGASSRFQRRETESYPTKSGILGLLAAALGIDKHSPDEREALRPLAALRFTAIKIVPIGNEKPTERLTDFHTIGGGWHDDWQADKSNLRAKMNTPKKAGDGSPFGTVITRRTYLTDARFVAVLEGPSETLERCAAALEDPKWGIWFGRKSCLPAAPLGPTLADSRGEAVDQLLAKLATPHRALQGQTEASDPASSFQSDHPISFGQREFQSRPVLRTEAPSGSIEDSAVSSSTQETSG